MKQGVLRIELTYLRKSTGCEKRARRGAASVTLGQGGIVTNYAGRSSDAGRYLQHGARSARQNLVEEARRENREREARVQRELFYAARRTR